MEQSSEHQLLQNASTAWCHWMNNKMFYQSIIRNLLRRYPVFFQLSHKQYICMSNKWANRPMTLTLARPHIYFETVEQTAVRLHTYYMDGTQITYCNIDQGRSKGCASLFTCRCGVWSYKLHLFPISQDTIRYAEINMRLVVFIWALGRVLGLQF